MDRRIGSTSYFLICPRIGLTFPSLAVLSTTAIIFSCKSQLLEGSIIYKNLSFFLRKLAVLILAV